MPQVGHGTAGFDEAAHFAIFGSISFFLLVGLLMVGAGCRTGSPSSGRVSSTGPPGGAGNLGAQTPVSGHIGAVTGERTGRHRRAHSGGNGSWVGGGYGPMEVDKEAGEGGSGQGGQQGGDSQAAGWTRMLFDRAAARNAVDVYNKHTVDLEAAAAEDEHSGGEDEGPGGRSKKSPSKILRVSEACLTSLKNAAQRWGYVQGTSRSGGEGAGHVQGLLNALTSGQLFNKLGTNDLAKNLTDALAAESAGEHPPAFSRFTWRSLSRPTQFSTPANLTRLEPVQEEKLKGNPP